MLSCVSFAGENSTTLCPKGVKGGELLNIRVLRLPSACANNTTGKIVTSTCSMRIEYLEFGVCFLSFTLVFSLPPTVVYCGWVKWVTLLPVLELV